MFAQRRWLFVSCDADNRAALRFYRRQGFARVGPAARSRPRGSGRAAAAQTPRLARAAASALIEGRVRLGPPMIGEQFGNYRSVALLGEGGMGAVYLAEHPAIGRRVAVKVLHKNYTRDEHLLARFLNEARAANAIRHPNIIEILDSGVTGGRHAVSGHGAAGGREPGHAHPPERRAVDRDGDRLRLPERVGAGRGPRQGDRPPRSQARQHVRGAGSARRAARAGQGARLRHREAPAGIGGRLGARPAPGR